MIYILALNPSLDYHMNVEQLISGETNRSSSEQILIGGKGINVAMMLNNLGQSASLLGFVGGFTGAYIQDELKHYPHIQSKLTVVDANTRINVKVKGKLETEINGAGVPVSDRDVHHIEEQLKMITANDLVVLTGRVANGMNDEWYLKTAQYLHENDIQFVVDLSGPIVRDICRYRPLLIKPNQRELEQIFAATIQDMSALIHYGRSLVEEGAQYCMVSRGKEGSLLFHEDHVYTSNVPEGVLVNSVGSGDSMVAGFIRSYIQSQSLEEMYHLAVSCGSATAFSPHLASLEHVQKVQQRVHIYEIEEEI